MTLEELKQTIEQNTGIPAYLLTGETTEENIAQAKALLAYRSEARSNPKDAFIDWYSGERYRANAALADIEAATIEPDNSYPRVRDGGSVGAPDPRSTRDKFAEWFNNVSAFDPRKNNDNWI